LGGLAVLVGDGDEERDVVTDERGRVAREAGHGQVGRARAAATAAAAAATTAAAAAATAAAARGRRADHGSRRGGEDGAAAAVRAGDGCAERFADVTAVHGVGVVGLATDRDTVRARRAARLPLIGVGDRL